MRAVISRASRIALMCVVVIAITACPDDDRTTGSIKFCESHANCDRDEVCELWRKDPSKKVCKEAILCDFNGDQVCPREYTCQGYVEGRTLGKCLP